MLNLCKNSSANNRANDILIDNDACGVETERTEDGLSEVLCIDSSSCTVRRDHGSIE